MRVIRLRSLSYGGQGGESGERISNIQHGISNNQVKAKPFGQKLDIGC